MLSNMLSEQLCEINNVLRMSDTGFCSRRTARRWVEERIETDSDNAGWTIGESVDTYHVPDRPEAGRVELLVVSDATAIIHQDM